MPQSITGHRLRLQSYTSLATMHAACPRLFNLACFNYDLAQQQRVNVNLKAVTVIPLQPLKLAVHFVCNGS